MVSSKAIIPKKVKKTSILKGVKSDQNITKIKIKSIEKTPKNLAKKEILKTVINTTTENVTKIKKHKFTMPSKYITESIVESCLNALDQLVVCTKNKNAIFDDEQQIFAEIKCIKIASSKGNVKFVLPHSTAASTGEICLITPDLKKGRKIDHEPTTEHWEDLLRKADVTCVKTVLPMRQLRVEYDQYELKRRLLTQHDFLMVDTRILSHVSHILGKMFFKKHNMLIPVRIDEKAKNIKECIDVGLRTTMLRVSQGPTSVIVVGHTGMPRQKLKENIIALVKQLKEKYPGGETNIRSLALKLPTSLSLPLYITLRSSNSVHSSPKIGQKKPKNFRDIEDELSTIPDSKVRVAPDGTVHVKKELLSKNEMSEDEAEDEQLNDDNSDADEKSE